MNYITSILMNIITVMIDLFCCFRIMLLKEFGFRDFNCSMIESIHEYLHLTTYTLNQHFNYLGKHSCFDALCKALDIAGKDK